MGEDPKDPPSDPAPPSGTGSPDEETVRGWIADAIAEALEGHEPPEGEPAKPTTAREREQIAEAAARKAVEAVKAADPKPDKKDPEPLPVEPVKKTRFRAAADKFWGVMDEAVKP